MHIPRLGQHASPARMLAAITLAFVFALPVSAQSVLSVGARSLQMLVAEQLFNRGGRWYLLDDGGCYTYLESPHTHIALDRLVLRAHLSSRLGQRIANGCVGADFASNITLSGKVHGSGHLLILEDIRIDRVDDEAARSALDFALQMNPQFLPRSANIDVSEFVSKNVIAVGGSSARLEEFRIASVTTRPDSIAIYFELSLSMP